MEDLMESINLQSQDGSALGDQPPVIKLGDASIASPFTHTGDTIKGVLTVLRCGRVTLSVVMQMYKIMAINSLISAFGLSVLTLQGVKFGDMQA